MFRSWPATVGPAWFGALGPPGREFRTAEPPVTSHAAFTEALVPYLAALGDRRLFFFGHCGGVPLALSTAVAMVDAGLAPPVRIFASGWGPPHQALYGPLNHVDLATADLHGEVERLFLGAGVAIRADLVDIAVANLRIDLELHRPHRYDASRRVPAPVTAIGWTTDDVVPAETAVDPDWRDCADAEFHVLEGEHFAFSHCPAALRELITARVATS
jgi:surfactin synthase thioesterase subunit